MIINYTHFFLNVVPENIKVPRQNLTEWQDSEKETERVSHVYSK